jgi:YD repeat-containing protein
VVWELRKTGSGWVVGKALATGSVEKVYWRPDGRSLAAIDADGGVTVWRVL